MTASLISHWQKLVPAILLTALATGCASEQATIPPSAASELTTTLNDVARDSNGQACDDARTNRLPQLERTIAELPGSVSAGVRQTLADGTDHLRQLVSTHCQQAFTPPVTSTDDRTDSTPQTTVRPRRKHKSPDTGSNDTPQQQQQPSDGATVPSPGGGITLPNPGHGGPNPGHGGGG